MLSSVFKFHCGFSAASGGESTRASCGIVEVLETVLLEHPYVTPHFYCVFMQVQECYWNVL